MPAPAPSNTRYSTPTGPEQPRGWTRAMSQFVRYNLQNGETSSSVIILLETEYPQMRDKVERDWIAEVGKGRTC